MNFVWLIEIVFNGNKYYYKKNNQRDIIGIYDSNYNLVVEYQYDVYGKVISIKDKTGKEVTNSNHIGKINPYRYRSYYFIKRSKKILLFFYIWEASNYYKLYVWILYVFIDVYKIYTKNIQKIYKIYTKKYMELS